MPSVNHSKKSSPEQRRISELERLIADQNKTIGMYLVPSQSDNELNDVSGNLEKKVKEAKKVVPIKNLIPKPPGQAGRGNGYKLLIELRLPKSRGRRILVSCWHSSEYMHFF
jgi:hypothetical protein